MIGALLLVDRKKSSDNCNHNSRFDAFTNRQNINFDTVGQLTAKELNQFVLQTKIANAEKRSESVSE